MKIITPVLLLLIHVSVWAGETLSPQQIFEQRIQPIFESEKPSSCVQCHLAGVDLSNYILPTAEKTFVSLRDQGMIDQNHPGESKILQFIQREPDGDSTFPTIHQETRQNEFNAFREWIIASCNDETLRNLPPIESDQLAKPQVSDDIIRHARLDGVLDSFTRNIWSLRFRCSGCHMSDGYNFEKLSAKHGEQMEWLKVEGPAATMRYLMSSYLIDTNHPEDSLLLLKPLNEVEHGGGLKMAKGDTDYMAFLNWIQDYSVIVNNGYYEPDELPERTNLTGSEIWLRIENLPDEWLNRSGLITIHAMNGAGKYNDKFDAVTSFNVRKNKRFGVFAQGFLMIDSKKNDQPQLPEQEYELRIYNDESTRNTTDFMQVLNQSTFVTKTTIQTAWIKGWKQSAVLQFSAIQ